MTSNRGAQEAGLKASTTESTDPGHCGGAQEAGLKVSATESTDPGHCGGAQEAGLKASTTESTDPSHRGGGTRGVAAWCLVGACGTLLGFLLLAAAAAAQEPSQDPSAATFEKMCVKCHPPDRIGATRRNRLQWEEILDKMTKFGAQGTDEEFDVVLDYLLRTYGKVNVNKADASEIALVVRLTPEDGTAIVQYRTAHGDFKDIDALAAVPGINAAKLKENVDAIGF